MYTNLVSAGKATCSHCRSRKRQKYNTKQSSGTTIIRVEGVRSKTDLKQLREKNVALATLVSDQQKLIDQLNNQIYACVQAQQQSFNTACSESKPQDSKPIANQFFAASTGAVVQTTRQYEKSTLCAPSTWISGMPPIFTGGLNATLPAPRIPMPNKIAMKTAAPQHIVLDHQSLEWDLTPLPGIPSSI